MILFKFPVNPLRGKAYRDFLSNAETLKFILVNFYCCYPDQNISHQLRGDIQGLIALYAVKLELGGLPANENPGVIRPRVKLSTSIQKTILLFSTSLYIQKYFSFLLYSPAQVLLYGIR